jgi:hypothetical protein
LFLGSAALDQVRCLGCKHARTNSELVRDSPNSLNCRCVNFAPHIGPRTCKLRLPTALRRPNPYESGYISVPSQNRVLFFGGVTSGANLVLRRPFLSLCAWASLSVASHGRGVNTSCRAFPASGNPWSQVQRTRAEQSLCQVSGSQPPH